MKECTVCYRCYEDYVESCPDDGSSLSQPLPYPLIIENKYRIDSLIGRGGMGAVYRATQLGLDRSVAIKILRPEVLAAGLSQEGLRHEALASARIEHPNVVTVHDYGTFSDGAGYLVMRLLKGRSLASELIAKETGLAFDRAFSIALQICAGVEAAHRLGIVHCDLKPDNIILEETDEGELVQVLDFGISRLVKDSAENPSSVFFATPFYTAPELLESSRLDFRSDIYSIGVIFYEMLTGRVPFTGNSAMEVLRKHIENRPVSPVKHRPEITPSLEKLVLTTLAKSPDRRQQSIAELIDQLRMAAQEMNLAGLLDIDALPKLGRRTGRLQPIPSAVSQQMEQPTLKIDQRRPVETTPLGKDSESPPLVMLVDDEPEILMIMRSILERLECRIVEAPGATQALKMLEQETPNLIVSDVMMPDMDGYKFYEALRERPEYASIPLVFLTARTQQDEKIQALLKGAEDFWVKPFDIKEIRVRIQRILERNLEMEWLRRQLKN